MSSVGDIDFAGFTAEVARALWGDENRALSGRSELRFGAHGSKSVDLEKGTWFDHADKVGGGCLDLIKRELQIGGREAVEWLRHKGFDVGDASARPNGTGRRRHANGSDEEPPPFEHGDPGPAGGREDAPRWSIARTWDYVDEAGELLFQVCRMENGRVAGDGKPEKSYRQRRPATGADDPGKVHDGWVWSVKGTRLVPYRLPEVLEAIAAGGPVFVVEGEKCADRLWDAGVPATCNPMGAGKWQADLTPVFAGADVVILPDRDAPGARHRDVVGLALKPVARSVRVLDLPGLPIKGDSWDWQEAGGTAEDLYDLVAREARPWRADRPQSRFGAVPWADLDVPGKEHDWLIKGLLARRGVSICAGPSKSGKSFLITDMALAIARGVEYAGRKTVRGLVVYQAGEGGIGLKKRMRAYRDHHGLPRDRDIPFVLLPGAVNLHASDDDTATLIGEIRAWQAYYDEPLELVVIDTLSAATPGANENASEDISRVLGRCQRMAEECDCLVLLVHHMNAQGARMRGHSSIGANVENVLEVRPTELKDADGRPMRKVELTKNKDGEDGHWWRFVLRQVEIGKDADGDPVTSCVVADPAGAAPDRADGEAPKGFKLNETEQLAFRALINAYGEHGGLLPAGRQAPDGTRGVTYAQWREQFEKIAHYDDDGSEEGVRKRKEAVKKAMQRVGASLLKFGIIGRDNPYVWWTGKKVRGFNGPGTGAGDMGDSAGSEPPPEPSPIDREAATLFNDEVPWGT